MDELENSIAATQTQRVTVSADASKLGKLAVAVLVFVALGVLLRNSRRL